MCNSKHPRTHPRSRGDTMRNPNRTIAPARRAVAPNRSRRKSRTRPRDDDVDESEEPTPGPISASGRLTVEFPSCYRIRVTYRYRPSASLSTGHTVRTVDSLSRSKYYEFWQVSETDDLRPRYSHVLYCDSLCETNVFESKYRFDPRFSPPVSVALPTAQVDPTTGISCRRRAWDPTTHTSATNGMLAD